MEFDRKLLENDFRAWIGPLCETVAPSGFEDDAADLVHTLLSDTQNLEYSTDALRNLIVHRPGRGVKIAVAAHLDEIGMMIRHIDERGFLWVETMGGVQPQNLFGKPVAVRTETGELVPGIIHHIHPGRPVPCTEMPTELSDFFIDIGAESCQDVLDMGVEVGNCAVLQYPTRFLGKGGHLVAGKALDDRACVYQLVELVRLLSDLPAPDFYAVFSTQEETGGRGAAVAADNLRPDIVIALDMSLSTDLPEYPNRKFINRLGGGVSIKLLDRSRFAACGLIADREIVRNLKAIARVRNLPYQLEAYTAGATDASVMQTRGGGIRCGGVQIPMRYVHSYEAAAVKDILDGLELLYYYVRGLA